MKTVLVVDDERQIAEIARDYLEHAGYSVLTAGDGRDALDIVRAKRPDLVVDAFNKIADSRPQWDLLILGDGYLRKSLEERIVPALRNRVVFTGFVNDQATVSALYRASDVMVLPSDFEPWALVVNEAAAAGLAIIETDKVGAAAELVRDGVNGFIFPASDLAKLTDRLLEVTDDSRIEELKAGSAGVLNEWRRVADPVNGLRQALASCGVLQ
jgi:glycosyltransferase involved in cell wall biosynthesis